MGLFERMKQDGHEQVIYCHDKATGLKAIIAIHDTTLGPALGGCRMWPYTTEEEALEDALRLAKGMTYKSAVSGNNHGGGKSVIWGNPRTDKSEELFRAFGRFIQTLGGRFITGTDVGTEKTDFVWAKLESDYLVGLPEENGGSGDSSIITAFGAWKGIKACAKAAWGSDILKGKRIAVQGVGKVGFHLVEHLVDEGAVVTVCDVVEENVRRAKESYPGVAAVAADDIFDVDCDIFSPNALGAILNDQTISRLKCKVVAGAANNQLKEPRHGDDLHRRGILYAPDYVINGGGLIQVADELLGYNHDRAFRKTAAIYDRLLEIFAIGRAEGIPTYLAADRLAERRIANRLYSRPPVPIYDVAQGGSLTMGIFNMMEKYGHEQIVFCYDKASGLKAIIGIHDTTLGPALGGSRMWQYASEEEALTDVVRLSRGMTYKNSAMGLNLGGGKAVIWGDAKTDKSEELFRAFGAFVQSLGGRYITAEDVNTTVEDMKYVQMETEHVSGRGDLSGDPSPVTAFGVYRGIKAAAKVAFGSESLKGKTVAVQGLGKVGFHLCEHLSDEGARLIVTDINQDAVQRAVKEFGATAVGTNEIYGVACDIYAPCALGATVNDETLPQFKCKVIAGAANNQLKEPRHADALKEQGILYAPDFVINGGGVINVAEEFNEGGYNRDRAYARVGTIYDKLMKVFKIAQEQNITSAKAAEVMAEARIAKIAHVHRMYVAE